MTIAFPAEWRLSRNEEAVLSRLALSDAPVPYAVLDAIIAPSRRGPVGRPFKVLLHYLRRKLEPHGITIISRKGVGFALTAELEVADRVRSRGRAGRLPADAANVAAA